MPRARKAPEQTATHMAGSVRPLSDPGDLPDPSLPTGQGPEGGAPQSPPTGPDGPSQPGPLPGELPGLLDPSGRPDEPITAGLGLGAGPGAEALGAFGPQSPTPDMAQLARYLPTLELLALQPGTSQKVRNMVRLIKSELNPELLAQPPVPDDTLESVGEDQVEA